MEIKRTRTLRVMAAGGENVVFPGVTFERCVCHSVVCVRSELEIPETSELAGGSQKENSFA